MAQCDDSTHPPTEDDRTTTGTNVSAFLDDFAPISVLSTPCHGVDSTEKPSIRADVSCENSEAGYTSSECSHDGKHDSTQLRFRKDQAEQWSDRYEELCVFAKIHGHCRVPRNHKKFASLSSWVKRQRYQYKLLKEGRASFLTDERVSVLEDLGFVWDSHNSVWDRRYDELAAFARQHGHANVPYNYGNSQLASWVKAQRREFNVFRRGAKKMTSPVMLRRFLLLERMELSWQLRPPASARAGGGGASPVNRHS